MRRLMRRVLSAAGAAALLAVLLEAEAVVPTPESVLGFSPCADYKLATYEAIAAYFEALDRASDRVQLVDIGATVEGRRQLMAIISSKENLENLAAHKELSRTLAHARGLTDETARVLASRGKAVVWIDFGLHSNEVAAAQAAPLMAYQAVTAETEEMRVIRDQVILLLVPNMNPDGTTLVSKWYMDHVGSRFERSPAPELYHRYAGHDNNRDWFMFNMPESQNVARQLYEEWLPQIVYDHHQAAPFPARIFVPPFDDPMNPQIPPLVMRGINAIGGAISRRLDQEGKRGAISRHEFDAWWNGGMRTAPDFHNMVGILTETAHPSATPITHDPKTFPKTFDNGVPTLEPTTYYPSPYLGGEWHLRDSCAYILSASMAVLDIGAKRREEWLYDIYQMGRDAIRAGERELYIVPARQWDPGAAMKMINVLRRGGVEVERAVAPFTADGRSYPEGSFVIRGAQPFRPYLTDLLNPQVYPERRLYPGGPPERPYDITGWTLPLQMGVAVEKATGTVDGRFERVDVARPLPSPLLGDARFGYAIDPRHNESFTAINRLLKAGQQLFRTAKPVEIGSDRWPAGTFVVLGTAVRQPLRQAVTTLGIAVAPLETRPAGELLPLKAPRIAVYRAYGGNVDEGWTRWVLEQHEFPFATVYDRDVRAGGLRARFDVLVLPDASYDSMLRGLRAGTMPDEYTGGMTPQGMANISAFVAGGGTLVALDSAAEMPITTFALPIQNVTASQRESDFYAPGTLLRIELDTENPVAFGMPARGAAFFAQSPAFAVDRPRDVASEAPVEANTHGAVRVVARYPKDQLLLSGWLVGEKVLAGKAAVVETTVEKGRVVLLGFRVQHRGQPLGSYKLLFNSLFLGSSDRAGETATATGQGRRFEGGNPQKQAVRQ